MWAVSQLEEQKKKQNWRLVKINKGFTLADKETWLLKVKPCNLLSQTSGRALFPNSVANVLKSVEVCPKTIGITFRPDTLAGWLHGKFDTNGNLLKWMQMRWLSLVYSLAIIRRIYCTACINYIYDTRHILSLSENIVTRMFCLATASAFYAK